MLKTITTTTFAALALSAAPVAAFAQDVVALDTQRMFATAAATAHVNTELQALQTAMQDELAPLEAAAETAAGPLREEFAAFQADVESRSLVERSQDESLQTRQLELLEREQALYETPEIRAYAVKLQCLRLEGQLTAQTAYAQIEQEAASVVSEVMSERGAVAVLDARSVLAADPSVNITETVVARLNQRLPAPVVTRATLPNDPENYPQLQVCHTG